MERCGIKKKDGAQRYIQRENELCCGVAYIYVKINPLFVRRPNKKKTNSIYSRRVATLSDGLIIAGKMQLHTSCRNRAHSNIVCLLVEVNDFALLSLYLHLLLKKKKKNTHTQKKKI